MRLLREKIGVRFAALLLLLAPFAAQAQVPENLMTPFPETSPAPRPPRSDAAADSDAVMGQILGVSFQGLNAYPETDARDIVGMSLGEILTRKKLENAINDLRKWGVFVKVEALVEYDSEGLRLTFELEEGFLIKDVSIHGNYPLLEGRVRRTLFLIPGQVYDKSQLPEQLDRLDRLYEQEGYFDTTVLAVEDYDEAHREVTLDITIKKGKTYRLRDQDVHGNTALNPKRISNIIFTYSHYKPRQIKKDLKKIRDIYHKKGFVRARVRLEGESYDYDTRKVDIEVGIKQGKRVTVRFEGNHHYFERVLRKHITIFEDGDFDDFELEASKSQLIRFYQEQGYESAQVDFSRVKLDNENYLVTFHIVEGPQRRVKKITFEGLNQADKDKIKELIQTKEAGFGERGYYVKPVFEEDLKQIEDYLRREGYLDAKAKNWDRDFNEIGDRVLLTVQIDEEALARVAELQIQGMPESLGVLLGETYDKLLSRPGRAYSPQRLDEDVQVLLILLSNHGYPYAKIDKKVVKKAGSRWKIGLDVDPGKHVTIGRVLFVGNSLTQEKVIRRNMRYQEGSEFSAKNILDSQLNLRRLGAFDAVNIETLGLVDERDVVHTVLRLQEKKTRIIDLEGGYNTDTGFSGKFVFNKLNMWGSGKNGNIKLQGGQEVNRLEINYIDPRLRGTSLQLLVGAYAGFNLFPFYQNFETGVFSTLFKDLGPYLSAYGRLDLAYVNFDESKTIVAELEPRESAEDRTRFVTTLGVTYDRRDSFGNPRKGYYLAGSAAFTKQFVQQSGNYLTLKSSIGTWLTPHPRVTFANALRVDKIFLLPSSSFVPADDRLYLGGDDTMRGFKQDSLLPSGGTFSLVDNFEMQLHLFGNFQLVGFLDTGIVINSMSDFNLHNLRHSAGPGIRYVTPVGPIRLDYGFILDRQPGEAQARLHFSFGYFF